MSARRAPVRLLPLLALAWFLLAPGQAAAAGFSITEWDGGTWLAKPEAKLLELGGPATQAASHPHVAVTVFSLATGVTPANQELPLEYLKDATVDLPPGLVGNPQAIPRCPVALLGGTGEDCPPETQVGIAVLKNADFDLTEPDDPDFEKGSAYSLHNLEPPPGVAALLGFHIFGVPVFITAELRSGGDYGVRTSALNANQTFPYKRFQFHIWGTPADPAHDLLRANCLGDGSSHERVERVSGAKCPHPEAEDPTAFLTLPTSCTGPVRWDLAARGWEGGEDAASFLSDDDSEFLFGENPEPPNQVGYGGCAEVPFTPTLRAHPTTDVADSPTGLEVELSIPQEEITDPGELAQAHLRHAVVRLPEGLTVNAAGANGLGACSEAQIDLQGEGVPSCPDASKFGRVEVHTPLLDHELPGALYLAEPYQNPFGSLIATYLVVNDPQSGVVVKLAGRVDADPGTGQLTASFRENPQLPFEALRISIPGGAFAPLRTPPACGIYTTTSELTPWSAPASGPPAIPSESWQISQGPGRPCAGSDAAQANAPSFDAGTVQPLAGRYSPLVVNLRREDGTQRFAKVTLTPPPGLLAKLAGTEICPDAALAAAAGRSGKDEQARPSCPATSRIGSVWAAAGAGPSPYWAPGSVFLAGPYKGAPLSMAIITPAVAGPFDLGTVVVRVALRVDPTTAQITAVSDPLPEILEGIPLDIRAAKVLIDRPQFTRNGTSCDPLAFSGQLVSTLGQAAALHSRFQLAECTRLGFKPRLGLRLKGGTGRGAHPALTTVLRPRPGDANIKRLSLKLPSSAFLDQAHIGTVCTRVQFAADQCPKGSIYGKVAAHTPLLDYPLRGNVYLRSSDNKLPDLVPDLRGPAHQPIRVESAGRTDSVKGALRNTFDYIPDAPIDRVVVRLFGGKRGLVINSRSVCGGQNRANVRFTAHNGDRRTIRPMVRNPRCRKGKKRKAKRSSHQRSNRATSAHRTR